MSDLPGRLGVAAIRERVAAAWRAAIEAPATRVAMARPVAIGWQTVELDRAVIEIANAFGFDNRAEAFRAAPRSGALRCACRVAAGALRDGGSLVVLEPDAEGRLAGSLARFGEGPAAVWLAPEASVTALSALRAAGFTVSPERSGPLGPERLIIDSAADVLAHGAHQLLVGSAPGRSRGGYHPFMTDPSAITFRPAITADAEAIAALFTDEGYPAGPSDIRTRLTRFASSTSRVVIAEHEGAILGFIAVHGLPRFEHDDWILRVLALVVDAGARERGIGRALLGEAERIGRELGAAFVELTAGHHRPEARHLYESLGYDSTVTAYLRKKL